MTNKTLDSSIIRVLTQSECDDVREKLSAHIDDLLCDIKTQLLARVDNMLNVWLHTPNSDDDDTSV